jgi:flagella synthesis protein FlgN
MSLPALKAGLQQEVDLVGQFLVALESETKNLLAPESNESLNESTRAKSTLASQIETATQTRDALLTQLGYGIGKAGLDAAAQNHPEIRELVAELVQQAEQARQHNASNGYIVETYLKYNQQALDTLRSLTGAGNLYDANGHTRNTAVRAKGIRAG